MRTKIVIVQIIITIIHLKIAIKIRNKRFSIINPKIDKKVIRIENKIRNKKIKSTKNKINM
jgi:hypothetical protein